MTFFYFIDKNTDRTVNWNLIYIDLGLLAVAILTFAFGYTGVLLFYKNNRLEIKRKEEFIYT